MHMPADFMTNQGIPRSHHIPQNLHQIPGENVHREIMERQIQEEQERRMREEALRNEQMRMMQMQDQMGAEQLAPAGGLSQFAPAQEGFLQRLMNMLRNAPAPNLAPMNRINR